MAPPRRATATRPANTGLRSPTDMLQSTSRGSRPCPLAGRAAFSFRSVRRGTFLLLLLLASWVLSTGGWTEEAAESTAVPPSWDAAFPEVAALQAVGHAVSLTVRPSSGGGHGGRSRDAGARLSVLLAFPIHPSTPRHSRITDPLPRRRVASQPHRATAPPSTS